MPSTSHRAATRTVLVAALTFALGAFASARVHAQDATPASTAPSATPATDTPPDTATESARRDAALQVLDDMDGDRFDAVHARFTPEMAAAISAERLKQIWTSLPAQIGAPQGRGTPVSETHAGSTLVKIPLPYEKTELVALIAFAPDGRIEGLYIKPKEVPHEAAPPVPADAHYREIELTVGDAGSALPATLTLPDGKGPFPAVVLVHGSGPQDRDESIGPNRPFMDIARGLAERGIAVLRYEKRAKARPQDYANGVTIDSETTDDAVRALATLRAQPGIDAKRIFVLGHSQGGMLAPRIAGRDAHLAGLIMLAAPARPLLDILIEQNRRLAYLDDGRMSDEENLRIMRLVDAVKAVRAGRELSPEASPLGLPLAYWQSMEAVDPVAEAAKLDQPMLFLQGARDIQVVDADWQAWKSAFDGDPRATFKLYESLNHFALPGEGEGSLQEYMTPGHVLPELIADVAHWIAQTGKPAARPATRAK